MKRARNARKMFIIQPKHTKVKEEEKKCGQQQGKKLCTAKERQRVRERASLLKNANKLAATKNVSEHTFNIGCCCCCGCVCFVFGSLVALLDSCYLRFCRPSFVYFAYSAGCCSSDVVVAVWWWFFFCSFRFVYWLVIVGGVLGVLLFLGFSLMQ